MEDVLAAQRRYFDSGATRPLRFRREMLTRLELALTRWEGELLEALKADLNKSPYEGYMSELGPTLPELVEAQRQKPRPLALYLFTRSRSVERAVLEALPFGGGCVNDTVVHLADPRLPFGGVGNSGMGACHGKAGFDAFTHEKSVLKKGRLDIPVRYPPYGKKHLGILKKLM